MTLENTFYIMGIATMSMMLILLIALVVTVLVIKSKIVSLHDIIEQKINFANDFVSTGSSVLKKVKDVVEKSH